MSAVLLPPTATLLPELRDARAPPSAEGNHDASMGVSPTLAMPLSRTMAPTGTMHVVAARTATPSRFSIWRELESRTDRLASYGALAVGVGSLLAFILL